jgi:threonine dehydrogenase-like Zn-dependent dehydrogenase
MTAAVEWLAHGKIDPTDLIDGRFPLAEAPAAFERAVTPGALKVLLKCETEKQETGYAIGRES